MIEDQSQIESRETERAIAIDPAMLDFGTVNLSSMEKREARWVQPQPSTGVITQPSPRR
jgi:hypothetical protein